MPITVQYQPSYLVGGELAHAAGRGRFLQEQDKYNYQRMDTDRKFLESQGQFDELQALRELQFGEDIRQFDQTHLLNRDKFGEGIRQFDQTYDLSRDKFDESTRQFDETLDQRGYEFDRGLQYKGELAGQRDRQFQQQLGQRGYEYDTKLAQNRDLAEMKLGTDLQLGRMRQEGTADYMAAQLAAQTQSEKAKESLYLKNNLSKIGEAHQEQRYRTAMAAADGIMKHQFRSQEQRDQTIADWERRYGEEFGEFPSSTPYRQQPQVKTRDVMEQEFESILGDDYRPGISEFFGRYDEDGNFVRDERESPQAKLFIASITQKNKNRAEMEKAQLDAEVKTREAQQERTVALRKQANKFLSDREKWVRTQVDKQHRSVTDDDGKETSSYFGGTKTGLEQQYRQEYINAFRHELPILTSPEELEYLPYGAPFLAPDGTIHFRPRN